MAELGRWCQRQGGAQHSCTGQALVAELQSAGEAASSSRAFTSLRDPKNDCLDSEAERRAPSGALIFGACWLVTGLDSGCFCSA